MVIDRRVSNPKHLEMELDFVVLRVQVREGKRRLQGWVCLGGPTVADAGVSNLSFSAGVVSILPVGGGGRRSGRNPSRAYKCQVIRTLGRPRRG